MASRELNILIKAKNLASGAISGVSKDLKGLEKIGYTAGRGIRTAGQNIGRGAAIAAGAIAYNVKAGVDSLVELNRVEGLTKAALKSTGSAAAGSAADIRKRAESLEALTTVDDKAIQNAENLLLTFRGIGKDAFDPTLKAALDLNAALGGDDQSLQGVLIQVGKAVNDPIKGLTALRRVGVSFSSAQEKRIKKLVDENRLFDAQKLILGELNKEFSGAARKYGQGPGADMRRFGDAVEDAQQALAVGFLPLIRRVSKAAQEFLSRPEVIKGIKDFGKSVAGAFDKAVDFLGTVNWDAVLSGLKTARDVAGTIVDTFLKLPPWVQTAVVTGWGLNKLTGGAVSSIVGQLASGLIKGVLNMNAGVVNINAGRVVGGPGGGAPGGGVPGGGFLAPGAGTLAAGIGGILGMYALPYLFQGPPGSGNVSAQRTIGTDANGKPITVKLDQQTTAMFSGLMPGFQQAVKDAGGQIVSATETATRSNDAALDQVKGVFSERLAGLRVETQAVKAKVTEGARYAQQQINTVKTAAAQQRQELAQQRIATARGLATAAAATNRVNSTLAAKNFSPTINANFTASVNTTVSVDSVVRSVTSAYVASARGTDILGHLV